MGKKKEKTPPDKAPSDALPSGVQGVMPESDLRFGQLDSEVVLIALAFRQYASARFASD